jgi:hypothetical protein
MSFAGKGETTVKKISKILLIALGISLLTVALGFLTSRPVPAQAPPPTVPVTVKNTAAQPVPTSAQGTTTVTGSVSASQAGPPWLVRAVQASPWRVSNPLNASNAPVPLLVQDVDSPGRYPFTATAYCQTTTTVTCQPSITLPSTTASGAPLQTVVIEFATGGCSGIVGSSPFFFPLGITGAGTTNFGFTVFSIQGSPFGNIGGANYSFFTQPLRLYGQPGGAVQLLVGVNTDCSLSLSGHLIPQ